MFGQRLESRAWLKEGKFPPGVTTECSDFFLTAGQDRAQRSRAGRRQLPTRRLSFLLSFRVFLLGLHYFLGRKLLMPSKAFTFLKKPYKKQPTKPNQTQPNLPWMQTKHSEPQAQPAATHTNAGPEGRPRHRLHGGPTAAAAVPTAPTTPSSPEPTTRVRLIEGSVTCAAGVLGGRLEATAGHHGRVR